MVKYSRSPEELFARSLQYRAKRIIGLEIELQAVNNVGKAASWKNIEATFKSLAKLGWTPIHDKKGGPIIGVKAKQTKFSQNDYILTDTGFCLIEIVLAPESDLINLHKRYKRIARELILAANHHGVRLLGYGIQPVTQPSAKLYAPRERYQYFAKRAQKRETQAENDISNYRRYRGTIIAANQSNINLKNQDEALRSLNVILALVPIQIALFANSPVWLGKVDPSNAKEIRQVLNHSNAQPWRLGMPDRPLQSMSQYFETIWAIDTSLLRRYHKYFVLVKNKPFRYFMKFGGKAVRIDGKSKQSIRLKPQRKDIELQNTFVWWDTRIKTPKNATYLENRVAASQPPGSELTVAALHLGIIENITLVEKLIKNYHWDDLLNSRRDTIKRSLNATIKGVSIGLLTFRVLKAAWKGLRKRDKGEEVLLIPLFERLASHRSPAHNVISAFKKRGVGGIMDKTELTINRVGHDLKAARELEFIPTKYSKLSEDLKSKSLQNP